LCEFKSWTLNLRELKKIFGTGQENTAGIGEKVISKIFIIVIFPRYYSGYQMEQDLRGGFMWHV
jgi:hypothetical protein